MNSILKERRSRSHLSKKLLINSEGVKDTIVWGDCASDHALNTLIDTTKGRCQGYDGAVTGPNWYSRPLEEMIYDKYDDIEVRLGLFGLFYDLS